MFRVSLITVLSLGITSSPWALSSRCINIFIQYYSEPMSLVLNMNQHIYSILFWAYEPCPQYSSIHLFNIILSLYEPCPQYASINAYWGQCINKCNTFIQYYSIDAYWGHFINKCINTFIQYYSEPMSLVLNMHQYIYSILYSASEACPQAAHLLNISSHWDQSSSWNFILDINQCIPYYFVNIQISHLCQYFTWIKYLVQLYL